MKLVNRTTLLKVIDIAATSFLALIIVFLTYYIGRAVMAPSTWGVITVSEIKENYDIGYLTIDILRPVVSGFSDRAFEKQLNLAIENRISLNKYLVERVEWGKPQYISRFYFHVDYWVKSTGGIFSLKITTVLEDGGTGMPLSSYYNADIANNEMLTLGELFIDSSYIQRLNTIISDTLAQRYPWRSDQTIKSVSEETKFFMKEGILYITFSKYEILSGSEGEPEFLIPTEEIKDLLKEEYKGLFK